MAIKLNVPFTQKDTAKALGAFWKGEEKAWFVSDAKYAANPQDFSAWLPPLVDKIYQNCFGVAPVTLQPVVSEKDRHYRATMGDKEFAVWQLLNAPFSEPSFNEITSPLVTEKTIFLDTETTGLENPEIVELGIVDAHGKEIFHSFFKPSKPIERGASEVNNITTTMLQFEPGFAEKWDEIQDVLLMADAIYAYNSPYDIKVIENSLQLYNVDTSMFEVVKKKFKDAHPICVDYAKANLGYPENKKGIKLSLFTTELGLTYKEKHTATADSWLILYVFNEMAKRGNTPAAQTANVQSVATSAVPTPVPVPVMPTASTPAPVKKQKYMCFEDLDSMQAFIASVIDKGGSFINYIPSTKPMVIYIE